MSDAELNFDSMSRVQKEALLIALRQKQIKSKENLLDTFDPSCPQQEKILLSPARIRAYMGGNGVGKSHALLTELLRTHLEQHPVRDTSAIRHSWVLVPNYGKVEDYVTDMKNLCPPSKFPRLDKMGTPNIRRLHWTNGSRTTFVSHDSPPMSVEGTNIDALFLDEPSPKALWTAAYRGLRNNPDYFVFMALTPLSEPWIYEEIYQPWLLGQAPDTHIEMATMLDNKYLSKEYIADFASRLSDDEYRVRILGEFSVLQGRVFKEFTRSLHIIEKQTWPENWPVWVGIDPHLRKPCTAVFIGITPDDDLAVIDEISFDGTIAEFADKLIDVETANKYNVVNRIIDNSGSATDWSRDTAVDIISKKLREAGRGGVSPVPKHVKDINAGLSKIRMLLRPEPVNGQEEAVPRLKFMDNCRLTIRDMEMYKYQDHRNPEKSGLSEKPRKINDDMLDPLRYICMSNPRHRTASEAIQYAEIQKPSRSARKDNQLTGARLKQYLQAVSKDSKKDFI